MNIAVVTLGIGDYWRGCKTLLYSLEKYGNLPDSVDRIMLYDPAETELTECDFARMVPVTDDYSDLPFPIRSPADKQRFVRSFKRVFAFKLPYDRIVYLDSDMVCIGDTTLLWGDRIGQLPFYACRDTAAFKYYPEELRKAAVDAQLIFNGGLEVFHPARNECFYEALLYRLRNGTLSMYDGADQGALNSYFQFNKIEVGLLPQGLNYILDPYCGTVPEWERRIIHFCGSRANPWTAPGRDNPEHRRYYEHWQRCWKECLG